MSRSLKTDRNKIKYEPSDKPAKQSSFRQNNHQIDAFKSSESLTKHPSITSLYSSTDNTRSSRRSKSFDYFYSQLSYSINPGISKRVYSHYSPQPEPLFRRNSLIFSPSRRKSIDLSVPQNCQREKNVSVRSNNNNNNNYNTSTIGRDIHIKVDRQLAPWEYSIFKYNPLHYDSSDFSDKQLTSKKSSSRTTKQQKQNK